MVHDIHTTPKTAHTVGTSNLRVRQTQIYTAHTSQAPRRSLRPSRLDTQIHQDVVEELLSHAKIDPTRISVKVLRGHVILSGFVSQAFMIRVAEAAIANIDGISKISNNLFVRK